MLRRWSLAAIAAVIVCGAWSGAALGRVVAFIAEPHSYIGGRGPNPGVENAVIGSLFPVKNIEVFDRSIQEDSLLRSPDIGDLLRSGFFVGQSIPSDAAGRGHCGCMQPFKFGRCRHQVFIFNRSYRDSGPVPDAVSGGRARILDFSNANDFAEIMGLHPYENATCVHEKVSAQFAPRSLSGFNQRPDQGGGGNGSRPKRGNGEPEIEARHAIGFSDLVNSRPLGAKVGIFIALRILAIGLIAFGYRLTAHIYQAARMTGGLVMVIGMALLAGVVELVGYS